MRQIRRQKRANRSSGERICDDIGIILKNGWREEEEEEENGFCALHDGKRGVAARGRQAGSFGDSSPRKSQIFFSLLFRSWRPRPRGQYGGGKKRLRATHPSVGREGRKGYRNMMIQPICPPTTVNIPATPKPDLAPRVMNPSGARHHVSDLGHPHRHRCQHTRPAGPPRPLVATLTWLAQ